MHRPPPGPFYGSMPSPDLPGARLCRMLDLTLSAILLVAAGSIWCVGLLSAAEPDIVWLTKISCSMVAVCGGIGLWLIHRTSERPRLSVSRLYDLVFQKLEGREQRRAVMLPPVSGPLERVADLIVDLARRVRQLQERADSTEADAADLSKSVSRDAAFAGEASTDSAAAAEFAQDAARAGAACGAAQSAVSEATTRAVALTSAVALTTDAIKQAAALSSGLAQESLVVQRQFSDLELGRAALMTSIDHVAGLAGRVVVLGQTAADGRPEDGPDHVIALAAAIENLGGQLLSATASIRADLGQSSCQTAEAVKAMRAILAHFDTLHDRVGSLSEAVCSQTDEIVGVLSALNQAQSGFIILRQSVEAVARLGAARLVSKDGALVCDTPDSPVG